MTQTQTPPAAAPATTDLKAVEELSRAYKTMATELGKVIVGQQEVVVRSRQGHVQRAADEGLEESSRDPGVELAGRRRGVQSRQGRQGRGRDLRDGPHRISAQCCLRENGAVFGSANLVINLMRYGYDTARC